MAAAKDMQIRGIAPRRDSLDDLQYAGRAVAVDQYTVTGFFALAARPHDGYAGSHNRPRESAQRQGRRAVLPLSLQHHPPAGEPPAPLADQMYRKGRVTVRRKLDGLD